jgi:hypothetical protein
MDILRNGSTTRKHYNLFGSISSLSVSSRVLSVEAKEEIECGGSQN